MGEGLWVEPVILMDILKRKKKTFLLFCLFILIPRCLVYLCDVCATFLRASSLEYLCGE